MKIWKEQTEMLFNGILTVTGKFEACPLNESKSAFVSVC